MDLRQLSPKLAVSPQIALENVADLAAAGFKILIINRPDQEVGADLDHDTITKAAEAAGMTVHYLPFFPGEVTPQLITDFAQATAGMGPAIAYCRSGHRSSVLWALSEAGKRAETEILETAANAGYDLTPVLPLIRSLANGRG